MTRSERAAHTCMPSCSEAFCFGCSRFHPASQLPLTNGTRARKVLEGDMATPTHRHHRANHRERAAFGLHKTTAIQVGKAWDRRLGYAITSTLLTRHDDGLRFISISGRVPRQRRSFREPGSHVALVDGHGRQGRLESAWGRVGLNMGRGSAELVGNPAMNRQWTCALLRASTAVPAR